MLFTNVFAACPGTGPMYRTVPKSYNDSEPSFLHANLTETFKVEGQIKFEAIKTECLYCIYLLRLPLTTTPQLTV